MSKEKRILYFEGYDMMPRNYMGYGVFHFYFKDVETDEEIILGECVRATELNKTSDIKYYEEIKDAEEEYYILWRYNDYNVSKINAELEEVQYEHHIYKKLVSNNKDIFEGLQSYFGSINTKELH